MSDKKYFLNNYEKETIILWNEAEKTAEVYTCSKSMMRKMDELAEKSPTVQRTEETEYSKTYILPKKYVKVVLPRQLSDETKRKMRLRMQEMRKKQKEEVAG
jgi:hypothetical protein